MPLIKDYYEPWNYNYEHLTTAKSGKHFSPVTKRIQKLQGITLKLNGDLTGKITNSDNVTRPKRS